MNLYNRKQHSPDSYLDLLLFANENIYLQPCEGRQTSCTALSFEKNIRMEMENVK